MFVRVSEHLRVIGLEQSGPCLRFAMCHRHVNLTLIIG